MTTSTTPAAPSTHRTGVPNKFMLSISIMLAILMQSIDGTIANVALPHMQGSMGVTQDKITWVLTSFMVATAIATPLSGWLSDRFGFRNIFIISISGFTIASMMCGLSSNISEIVISRVLQGALGAALIPAAQAVLLEINPPEEHGQAMAMLGIGVMLGPILGPTVGGWITDTYSWRWVFFINLPIGLMALWGLWKFIPESSLKKNILRFDFLGFSFLGLAIGSLQLLLDRGQGNGWFNSLETWIEAVVLVVCLTYFIIHTATKPAGKTFFNYRLLTNANFMMGLLFIFVVGIILYATRALTPSLLQGLMGYTAFLAGWITSPSGIANLISMVIVARLFNKIDIRIFLLLGFALVVYSLWEMSAYSLQMSEHNVVIPNIVQGFGFGLLFVPISAMAFSTLPAELIADGTAFFSLIRNIGGSIGISIVQTFLSRNMQILHTSFAPSITISNPAFSDNTVRTIFGLTNPAGALLLNDIVTQQSALLAYTDDFWLMALIALVAMPFVFFLKKGNNPSKNHVAMD